MNTKSPFTHFLGQPLAFFLDYKLLQNAFGTDSYNCIITIYFVGLSQYIVVLQQLALFRSGKY